MIRKIASLAMLGMTCVMAYGQNPAIPLNPEVRHGKLDNGLTYYLLHNEEPKERANFYIAQKVGSTLENENQLGLAHFLEHMAFNGTKHYPGKNMLNYLQSKGIRFGADINAYTGFDETVYNIDNVPTTDKALMDSVLLVLSDWSGSILLEEDEINAERGVIEEEWRSRRDAQNRMFEAILPVLYKEYQYQQMPIGKMEIVRNFPPQAIRDYYHKWYRPDQQGIVIVGDFDVNEMEQKVKDLFSKIPMPENAAPRVYPTVSDNEKPIFAYFTDKEMPYKMISVSFKSDKIPFEERNTVMAYMQERVVQALIEMMINNRLQEHSKDPNCKYSYAGVSFGDFYVSTTKDAFDITIIAKDGIKDAYDDALAIVARACKTGFMESELVRARDELLSTYEKAYNERKSTKTSTLARRLIRTFIDNTANPGAEQEYTLMKQVLPVIPVQELNMMATQILTPDNQVIVVSQPEREGMEMVSEEVMTADLNKIINAEYTAYVDEELPSTLVAKAPKAGKIKSEKAGQFGTTEFTLSNGAKVVIKPTDFKADEILFTAFRKGGRDIYSKSQAANVMCMSDAVDASKFGEYKASTVSKYLAGKKVELSYSVGNAVTSLKGQSTVKDLPVFMEVLYETMTDLQPDTAAYRANIEQTIGFLREQEKSPQFVFSSRLDQAQNCHDDLYYNVPSVSMLEKADYTEMLKMAKQSMANAADFTFLFVGNIDAATLKPLLEKYIASLPSKGKASQAKVISPRPYVKGDVKDHFDIPMATPSTQVFVVSNGTDIPYSIANSCMISAVGDIMDIIYTETLREEEGGTYSPQGFGGFNQYTNHWQLGYWFQTNADVQQKLVDRANTELSNLLKNGAKAEHFNKVREAMAKQYEINVRTNSYWKNNLTDLLLGFDNISGHKAAIDGMTVEGLNKFMKQLDPSKNRLDFVMTGVAEK